jgi:hypothetical protein
LSRHRRSTPSSGIIERRYRDALGNWRQVPAATLARIRAALREEPSPHEAVRVIRAGQRATFNGAIGRL